MARRREPTTTSAPARRRGAARPPAPGPEHVISLLGFTDPHVVAGLRYALDVTEGRINACKWVRLACARQLKDLERSRTDRAWPFEFNEELAGRAARFLERLPHIQGALAGALIRLEGWQAFVQTTVYGWVYRGTRNPRFRRIYEEVPRGNGKSIHLSGNTLYSFAQGEEGAEITPAAVDREQARKVYDIAVAMLRKRPSLQQKLGVEITSNAMVQVSTNSSCYPLSREAKKNGDGKNIFFAPVDELHAHRTRDVYDVLDTGTGKRATSRIWIITTAGFNTAGICYEKRRAACKVLDGVVVDDALFAIIYTIDDEDDWTDAACREACTDHSHPSCTWRKANPNWGVSVDVADFEMKMRSAMHDAGVQNEILTKHLNIWCNSARAFLTIPEWNKCHATDIAREDFVGDSCIFGLDLGSTDDLTCKALLFWREEPKRDEDGVEDPEGATERHYYVFLDTFAPEAAIENPTNAQYEGWKRNGYITATDGNVTDYRVVGDSIRRDAELFHPGEIPYDPWNSGSLIADLMDEGLPMVKFNVNVQNFSPAMKELGVLVRTRRLHHDGNPVLAWMVSNVEVKEDNKGNVFPRKIQGQRGNKIDGFMAMCSAVARAIAPKDDSEGGPSMYETEGFTSV